MAYFNSPEKTNTKKHSPFLWNLQTGQNELREIQNEFLKNSRFLKKRKNGVIFYHEILSFHHLDQKKLTTEIWEDITLRYIELRAPHALVYAHVHHNPQFHIHLAISANERKSAKKIRISKFHFQRIKIALEEYQQARYPELIHSRVEHKLGSEKNSRTKRQEKELCRRLKKSRAKTDKEIFATALLKSLQLSLSESDFHAWLEKMGVTLYQRGKNTGIRFLTPDQKVKKFRFKNLGVEREYFKAQERWEKARNLTPELRKIVEKNRLSPARTHFFI